MSSFLSEISDVKKTLNVINITWKDINDIKESILKEQNLKDLNELRDKFEGVAYYEAIHKKMSGVIALEKLFKRKFINWENLKPKLYKPIIEVSGKKFLVVTTSFGKLPIIPTNNNLPIILAITKEERAIWLIGLLNPENFDNSNNFKIYKHFKTIEEFNSII